MGDSCNLINNTERFQHFLISLTTEQIIIEFYSNYVKQLYTISDFQMGK